MNAKLLIGYACLGLLIVASLPGTAHAVAMVPEIDGGTIGGAVALLSSVALLFRGRRPRKAS